MPEVPWSPVAWWRAIARNWQAEGPVKRREQRGYWFWGPTILIILAVELLGALSSTFKNKIPWPTISSTVGHLEKRWDWVGVIVVGVITATAFQALAYKAGARTVTGRAQRPGAPPAQRSGYSWLFVLIPGLVAIGLAIAFGASKIQLGYIIYGVLAVFGIVIPSVLAFVLNKEVRFPTLFFTLDRLRRRFHAAALILVTGLAILVVHLAFYPWPDITHESASFAGLTAQKARDKAEREVRRVRGSLPQLEYSTQSRAVSDGHDVWLVYFRTASGGSSACAATLTRDSVDTTEACSK
ncbi:MAG TPA: hypothetical protein VIL91_12045 [Gaiellaceae bacterium]